MKTEKEVEAGLLEMYNKERSSGNSRLKSSNMLPRNQGKIHALRWILGMVDQLNFKRGQHKKGVEK